MGRALEVEKAKLFQLRKDLTWARAERPRDPVKIRNLNLAIAIQEMIVGAK